MRRTALAVAAALTALTLAVAAGCGSVNGNSGSGSGSGSDNSKSGKSDTGKGSGSSDNAGKGKTITIGWIPWDEDVVATNLWKQVLESKGYKVKMTNLDAGPLYTGMADGDIDVFLDGWLPLTHAQYWKQYGSKLDKLGVWYDHATLDITVPDYVKNVQSIGDLAKHADEFDGKIVGIEGGAGITSVTQKQAIPKYGLSGKMSLQVSSTPAMLAALQGAVQKKQPIVVTLWRPHWAYAKMPLRDLKDPKGAMGKAEQITIISRKGFDKDFPDVAKWLSNFRMDDKQLGTLEDTALNKHKDNPAAGVTEWMKANPDFVQNLTK